MRDEEPRQPASGPECQGEAGRKSKLKTGQRESLHSSSLLEDSSTSDRLANDCPVSGRHFEVWCIGNGKHKQTNKKIVSNLHSLLKLQWVKEGNITVSNNFPCKADLWSLPEPWFYLMKNTYETSNRLRGNPPSLTYLQPGDRFCVCFSSFASHLRLLDTTAGQQRCNSGKVNLDFCLKLNVNLSIQGLVPQPQCWLISVMLHLLKKNNKKHIFPWKHQSRTLGFVD